MRQQKQGGFTLVEIMVVVVIIGLLATVVAQSVFGDVDLANLSKVKTDIAAIKSAATRYRLRQNRLPDRIDDLITPDESGNAFLEGEEVPKDPWGNEYVLEREGNKIVIISCGVDGDRDTGDDITSKNMANLKALPREGN